LPIGYENWPVMPTVLYQGMLAPIAPLSISGAIWYQGEQNSPCSSGNRSVPICRHCTRNTRPGHVPVSQDPAASFVINCSKVSGSPYPKDEIAATF
jgi:hypothetical protein